MVPNISIPPIRMEKMLILLIFAFYLDNLKVQSEICEIASENDGNDGLGF